MKMVMMYNSKYVAAPSHIPIQVLHSMHVIYVPVDRCLPTYISLHGAEVWELGSLGAWEVWEPTNTERYWRPSADVYIESGANIEVLSVCNYGL